MAHQATTTDVPVMVNGRKATATYDQCAVALAFPKVETPIRPDISCVVVGETQVGVCLKNPACIVPGTSKPVASFLLQRSRFMPDDEWFSVLDDFSARRDAVDYRAVSAVSTMCGSTTLQFDNEDGPIVAWTDKACTVVNEPKAIILQRTRGGMTSYDAHVLPCLGTLLTVEMLPHSTMEMWALAFGDERVIDAGADPVPMRLLHAAHEQPSVRIRDMFECNSRPSDTMAIVDEDSEWSERESESESESEESSGPDTDSSSEGLD